MDSFDNELKAFEFLAQIAVQHDLSTACLKIVGSSPALVENFRTTLLLRSKFDPEKVKRISSKFVESIVVQARSLEQAEFSLLSGNTLVALCGGLENLVKETVWVKLMENPALVSKLGEQRAIKVSLEEFLSSGQEERARLIVDRAYRESGARHGPYERFLLLLKTVEAVPTEPPKDDRKAIDDAFEVRNAIVHNGSRIDRRLLVKVGNEEVAIGNPFELHEHDFKRYRTAILKLASVITFRDL